jgi:hypothetical protein
MNEHVDEYYREFSDDNTPSGNFHRVISLHTSPDLEWEDMSNRVPSLPRGWYELARLSREDRLEFVCDFWLSKLPYMLHTTEALTRFFSSLDDIGIYITQETYDTPYISQMVYSLKDEKGFFHGYPPISEEGALVLQDDINIMISPGAYMLPADYTAFLEVHDGFCKYTDTGLVPSRDLKKYYQQMRKLLSMQEPLVTEGGIEVNPKSLIPFYESFGLNCYQCFWGEWYPDQEMGNVYYSGMDKKISKTKDKKIWEENMAFPTFLDWLVFYLEDIQEEIESFSSHEEKEYE